MDQNYDQPHEIIKAVVSNVEKVIVGKSDAVHLCLTALLAGGHVLLEDVPGVGKTMLVKALAKSLGCSFKRIQFTPDLLPSDVTGVSIYNQKTQEFEFRPGPIMANVVLADEINRTSPKTQSALLEAMEEGGVTVDGTTHVLQKPFMVMATQNPIEYEGTFPLPEAQLDRFLLKIRLGYPSESDEFNILSRQIKGNPIETIEQVIDLEGLQKMQEAVFRVHVDNSLREYIVKIAASTRENRHIYLGVSPRGSIALLRASMALAFILGRDYVVPDDIKRLVPYTFGHRIIPSSESRLSGITVDSLLQDAMRSIPVPVL
ncbi:AAA family ATPase [Effusibacillus dendaii]|uniref:AAA family ATPase n=1 Tax=Effusibacillus dendaii TaxID=2743772 RepID=UPI00190DEE77|nr:MoxR family ATPase [Effusibacillus dendaii]